ncbi:MAG: hypothetical protein DWP95_00250 [Proteobacteria bacterium]|nr:MAG: hypothetical protein DWP95_00250 [Pseudomonadota bacterium]
MKPHIFIVVFFALLQTVSTVHANTLNEVVKEARKQGQVLSAKTRQGMHEVRVVTPQGSVKTIRKPVSQNNQSQRQPALNYRQNYYQQQSQPPRQDSQRPVVRRENQYSRKPEFRRFQRPSQSTRPPQAQHQPQQHQPEPRRVEPRRRTNDNDPD